MSTANIVACPDLLWCLVFDEINENRTYRQVSCHINVSCLTRAECPWFPNVSRVPVLCSNITATHIDIKELIWLARLNRGTNGTVTVRCPLQEKMSL